MRPTFHRARPTVPKTRLIIGRKPLIEALQQYANIEKIFVLQSATGEEIYLIKKLARERGIPVSHVPAEKLDRFTQSNHQGVLAIAGLITFQPLQEIISQTFDKGESPLVVLLDGITDTRNLGAIARSALCYGAHALVLPVNNSAAITEDSIKTSAGALEHLPVCRVASLEQAIETLHLNGFRVYATTLESNRFIYEEQFEGPIALVMGSEDQGISEGVLRKADSLVKIPMPGNFDSLNVSVATGIMLYEAHRQRLAAIATT